MWGGANRYSPAVLLLSALTPALALPVVLGTSTDEEGYLATGTMHVDSLSA